MPQRKTQAALNEEGPRPAASIALITKQSLDTVLYQLRSLEDEGKVRSRTDDAGIQRWELSPELGGQVFIGSQYRLTPAQLDALGL